jgi:putative FmdB family regulatory protein
MPTYIYRCKKCKRRFELFHSITDETPKRCPRCKGKAERVPAGGAGILFKGSGFYETDYRSKSYKESAKREKAGGPSAGSSGGESGGTSTGKSDGSSGSGGSTSTGKSGGSSGSGGGASGGKPGG